MNLVARGMQKLYVYRYEISEILHYAMIEIVLILNLAIIFCRYKLGFCPNGPDCRYRHAKLPGPPPPVEEVLQKIQQLTSYNFGPNRFYQPRNVAPQLQDKPQGQVPTQSQPQESGNLQQQQQQQPQQSQHQVSQTQIPNPADQTNRSSHPLPQGVNRFVQSPKVFNWVM